MTTSTDVDVIEEYTERYYELIDEEIRSTDWEEYDIVDVVETPDSVSIYRYADEAPWPHDYVSGEDSVTVTRTTNVQLKYLGLLDPDGSN